MFKKILYEDSRSQSIQKSKTGDNYSAGNQKKGKNRYQRRLASSVQHSVKNYNSIDMNKLFRDNILDVNVEVKGETNTYTVKVSFGGFLDALHSRIKNNECTLRDITQALTSAFNSDNVYFKCSCPDFKYRFAYWASRNDVIAGDPEVRPSDITNPKDTKGAGCKHVNLVLSNNTWLIKVASVIMNYINYMKEHYQKLYADIIYPAIYEGEYEEPVQLQLDDTPEVTPTEEPDKPKDELKTDKEILDISNKYARTKNQFKQGNTQGVRFAPKEMKQINFDELISDSNK